MYQIARLTAGSTEAALAACHTTCPRQTGGGDAVQWSMPELLSPPTTSGPKWQRARVLWQLQQQPFYQIFPEQFSSALLRCRLADYYKGSQKILVMARRNIFLEKQFGGRQEL
jgi:hypothetical protein